MAASIIYFGRVEDHRAAVLEGAGYDVLECKAIPDFKFALYRPPPRPDAVAIDGVEADVFKHVRDLVCACSFPTPIIHFPATYSYDYKPREIDLVIPPLTRPAEWLREIADALERSRVIQNEYHMLRARNEQLRNESRLVSETTARELERIARARQEHEALENAAWPHIKHPRK